VKGLTLADTYSCLRHRQHIHRFCGSCWQHLSQTRWLHWTQTRATLSSGTNFLQQREHFFDTSSWLPRITPRIRNSRISRLIWLSTAHVIRVSTAANSRTPAGSFKAANWQNCVSVCVFVNSVSARWVEGFVKFKNSWGSILILTWCLNMMTSSANYCDISDGGSVLGRKRQPLDRGYM